MINIETEKYASLFGDGGWRDQIHRELVYQTCVCFESALPDDEVVTDFAVLDPREARVEDGLLELIAQAKQTVKSGQKLVLIRWRDDVESLVVFPVDSLAPSPELLMWAYNDGFVMQRTGVLLDQLWGTP